MRAATILMTGSIFVIAAAAPANAQDAGRVGLTTGYPGAIGILWHTTERIAVRPQFSFTNNASSSDSSFLNTSTDFWSVGTEVSVLFFSPLRDDLKIYVAPRFGYTRTNGTTENTESTANAYSIAGLIGGHYALGRRFAVFGEAGLQYSHTTSSVSSSTIGLRTTSTGDSVGTRTGIGVVLYF